MLERSEASQGGVEGSRISSPRFGPHPRFFSLAIRGFQNDTATRILQPCHLSLRTLIRNLVAKYPFPAGIDLSLFQPYVNCNTQPSNVNIKTVP